MTDKTNELKCCPFCGNADVTVDIFDGVNDDWKARWSPEYVTELGDDFVIMCDKCGFTTGEYAEPEHIIERWNRRYDHAAADNIREMVFENDDPLTDDKMRQLDEMKVGDPPISFTIGPDKQDKTADNIAEEENENG